VAQGWAERKEKMLYSTGHSANARFRIIAASAALTCRLALPAGLLGWAATWGVMSLAGIESNRPLWFLPILCLWFFCISLKHFAGQEKFRTAAPFEKRWKEAEKKLGLAA
jgi:hypothetical protein